MIAVTKQEMQELVEIYSDFEEWAFDTETFGPHRADPRRANVFMLSLAGPGRADVVAMGHPTTHVKQLYPGESFEILQPLFFNKARKIGHNLKFDLMAVWQYYKECPTGPFGDTLVMAHLLDIGPWLLKLEKITEKLYGFTYDSLGVKGPHRAPFYTCAQYSYFDAKYTWLIYRHFKQHIDAQGLRRVFELEMDTLEVITSMEYHGTRIDIDRLHKLDLELRTKQGELQEEIFKIAGRPFNLNAPQQKGWFVYEVRGHKAKRFTEKKQDPSTDAEALAAFASKDPAVATMVEWVEVSKLLSTYVESYKKHRVGDRIFTDFRQWGTDTGRFSSREPNLQNIPRPDSDSPFTQVRSLFIPPEGRQLIVADYSQIELRVLAFFSRDPHLIRTFKAGGHPHVTTAARVLGKDPSEIKAGSKEYQLGKNLNFAVVYGAGAAKVAAMSGISESKAKTFLDKYIEDFPVIWEWKKRVVSESRSRKPAHVRTLLGRIRRLPALKSADPWTRSRAERQAVNTVVQGSSADLIKLAMVRFHALSEGTEFQLLLTVHDELVVSGPTEIVDDGVRLLRNAMEGIALIDVPLLADVKVVDRWSEAK